MAYSLVVLSSYSSAICPPILLFMFLYLWNCYFMFFIPVAVQISYRHIIHEIKIILNILPKTVVPNMTKIAFNPLCTIFYRHLHYNFLYNIYKTTLLHYFPFLDFFFLKLTLRRSTRHLSFIVIVLCYLHTLKIVHCL